MKNLLFQNKGYLMLWLSTLTTRFGNALTLTVLVYHIGSHSGNAFMISMVLLAQMVPMVLIGLFAGSIADRMPKFVIMISSEWLQLFIVGAMIFSLDYAWLLIFLIFIQGAAAAFYGPAKTAYLPELVAEQKLSEAIGLSQATSQSADLIGPPIAGALLLMIQSREILMIDLLTFFISALFIFASSRYGKANRKLIESKVHESLLISIGKGLKEVSSLKSLKFLIVIVFVLMLAAGVFNATSVSIELQIFHVNGFQYGLLQSVGGIGAILGSFAGPLLIKRINPGKFIITSGTILGIWMTLIFFIHALQATFGLAALFIWISIIGLLNSCLNVPVSSLFLLVTPPTFRGRAVGIMQMFTYLGCIIGLLVGGTLTAPIGMIQVTIIAGVAMTAVSLGLIGTKGYKQLIHEQNLKSKDGAADKRTFVE
ncbi:MFS transporter [Sporolactobacillus shoreicorticis]|uniref:MFS transporter n=1 Tax=Sporolactobacillus shoreicorticis TaxID=1923877 RepID=A0ABW5S781_9BACL|nr:MFS transporter [Sporolactobacillus shoreicorticis]MCO7126845.1 MFS transporter [Sporolactobacillus shoreicorticis]